ncbi:MAG: hypothetical protein IAG10_11805, partial [Planctomycetaceae bacterium]|nr:hypothetical protein [Planctomycetaceae bacterium]
PALVNPAGLDFISVTYEAAGQSQQLFFSPYEFMFGWPSQFNQATADWFEVIREATIAATGRAPARTSVRDLKVPASSRWGLALLLIPVAIPMAIMVALFVAMRAVGNSSGGIFGIGWPELIIFGTMSFSLILPVMFFLILRATSRRINVSKGLGAEASAERTKETVRLPMFPTNRGQFGGLRLVAVALALGLVVIGYLALLSGRVAQMLTSDLYLTLLMLFPFMIVGLVAGVASRRGTVVGLWALLTGVVVVAAIDSYGYLAVQEAVRKGAWTGAALTQGMFAIAAIPASLVGSFVGVAIGLFIVRFGKNRSNGQISPHGAEPPPDGPLAAESKSSTDAEATRRTGTDTARPNPSIIETMGFHTKWGQRFLKLSHLGFLGFLSFLPGLDRVAGMFGFFGFMGLATLCEMRARYQHWPRLRRISAILGIALAVALAGIVVTRYVRMTGSVAADVLVQQSTVDQGHFSFHHDVKCPPGWNVWLTLENAQLFKTDDSADEPREPGIVSRYQAKLAGNGRVRVPLEYLPASDEGRSALTL